MKRNLDAIVGVSVLVFVVAVVCLAVGHVWSVTIDAPMHWRVLVTIVAGWTALIGSGVVLRLIGRILSGDDR